jgi:hypothetical protein
MPRPCIQHVLRVAGALLLAAQAVVADAAPPTPATILGAVRDEETGAPIAGALVALTDLDRTVVTDEEGRYMLPAVPAGPHHIAVRSLGYAQRTLHALVPREGALEINVSLRPEPVHMAPVEVGAPVIIRGLDAGDTTAFPDRDASIAAIHNHPLLSEPDALQVLGGGEVVLDPETPRGIHVRGGAPDQTAYLLDGIPVFSPYHSAGVASAWNPDALAGVHLSSSTPPLEHPQTLSGSIEAVTRAPSPRLRMQGSASTTQARLALDGPIGGGGAGYVLSLRSGLPEFLVPSGESSYLLGETGDAIGKLEAPALGGRIRLLGYDSENDVNAAAITSDEAVPGEVPPRNVFEWQSTSLGVDWRRATSSGSARVSGWSASCGASAVWAGVESGLAMTSTRRDLGVLAIIERRGAGSSTTAGVRFEESETAYRIEPDSTSMPFWSLDARTAVAAGFARHARSLGPRVDFDLGATLAATSGDVYVGPRARLSWSPTGRLTFSGHYARTHQFAQSLRNPESVVGNVFPADLYVGAGAPGVPVARSDQGVIAAEVRPAAGVRVGVQAYARDSDQLLLVAPRDGEPFSTGGDVAIGSGTARGIAFDASVSAARYGIVASYGIQRVRFEYGDSSYVPENGATHLVDGGVILFPSATASVRVGASAAFGRQTTRIPNAFEWEACNLVDQGCEFGGSPHYAGAPLGATDLPDYVRVDVGVRKHWHLAVGGRDAMIAVFGTMTNVLGRKNLLTYATDTATGERLDIEMRPQSPLVVGVDWRF